MKKQTLFLFSFILLFGIMSSVEGFTNTIDIKEGQTGGFNPDVGDTPDDYSPTDQYEVIIESFSPNNLSFRLGRYDLSTTPATRFSSEKIYHIQVGAVVIIDEPNIDVNYIKWLSTKYKEFPCGDENGETIFCQDYIARMVFSSDVLSAEISPSRFTTCEENICTLSSKDVLIMAALDGEEYAFNIRGTFPEDNGVELDINKKHLEFSMGEFVDLNQFGFPIEISINEISKNYIVFETKEPFDSYRVVTPENFLQQIWSWFRNLFG